MSKSAYILRALLYIALSVLPVLIEGYKSRTAYILVGLMSGYQTCLTLRAFIDTSSSYAAAPPAPTQQSVLAPVARP
jgi:hypothetical protein